MKRRKKKNSIEEFNAFRKKQRYNFKWEKSNLKLLDLSWKLPDLSINEDEDEKCLSLELSSYTMKILII